mgnify:CR=1 FL=1
MTEKSENAIRPLSDLLKEFQAEIDGEQTSVGEILQAFHERGFGVVLFVFALPMALPVPVPPGVNILLALPLLLLTAQQMMGRHTIWLPEKLKAKTIKTRSLNGILGKAIPKVIWMEGLTRPRLAFMTSGLSSHIIGLAGFIMALAICVPIPLSNTVPSFGIAIMAIGVLMRDGLAVLFGMLIGLTWVACLSTILIFIGVEGVDAFKEAIKTWL